MPPDNVKIILDNSTAYIKYWDFYITTFKEDEAKQSKLLLPEIKKQCAIQIEKLEKAGGAFNRQKIAKIKQALIYLEKAMDFKMLWCSKSDEMMHQGKNEPIMDHVIYSNFTKIEHAMTYCYNAVDWHVRPATENDQRVYKSEYDGHGGYPNVFVGYNRNITEVWEKFEHPILHCSLQDALNLSPSNLFNFGLFGKSAYYGTMWGKTKELSEVETSVKSAMSL